MYDKALFIHCNQGFFIYSYSSMSSKSVFITGAGKRLGRHFAIEFARRGYDVAVHYYTSKSGAEQAAEEIQKLGRKSVVVQADARSGEEMRSAMNKSADVLGAPQILVSNSGFFPKSSTLQNINDEQWNEALSVNVLGGFYAAQAYSALRPVEGRIVVIASLGGMQIWRQRIPYNVSKAAAIQLSKALARELAPEISVNCVCPGAVLVECEPSPTESSLLAAERIPMKRYATPDDVFDAVYFFSTASRYITGQVVAVDGGILLT